MKNQSELLAAIDWSRMTEGGDVRAVRLVEQLGYSMALDRVSEREPESEEAGVASIDSHSLERWRHRLDGLAPFDLAALGKLGLEVLTWEDATWPVQIDDLGEERPLCLWVKGSVQAVNQRSIAIVGSRNASNYGKKIARDLGYEFASRGFTIVSGGAFGIDVEAHRGALLAEGRAVIVSAGGAERPYPQAHAQLFTDVVESGGAVVSESPLGAAPQRHRFLSRNRIIAALASVTIVVEAPFRSGALNTARHAMNIGREVGAFPGPIDSPHSTGCHEIIRNGGTLVSTFAHVEELVGSIGEQLTLDGPDFFHGSGEPSDDPLTKRVIDALPRRGGSEVGKIASVAGLSLGETLACLGRLDAEGRVAVRHGRWRAIT